MSNDIPVMGSIKPQSQTDVPITSDSTIMDDTVITMDGVGLMGGPTVTMPPMQQTVENIKPRGIIRTRR